MLRSNSLSISIWWDERFGVLHQILEAYVSTGLIYDLYMLTLMCGCISCDLSSRFSANLALLDLATTVFTWWINLLFPCKKSPRNLILFFGEISWPLTTIFLFLHCFLSLGLVSRIEPTKF